MRCAFGGREVRGLTVVCLLPGPRTCSSLAEM